MCSECSALLCQGCIDKLDLNNCPKCRCPQSKEHYARNRPVEDIIKETQLLDNSNCKLHDDFEKCYFCETCQKAHCPECLNLDHLFHERKSLKSAYKERK